MDYEGIRSSLVAPMDTFETAHPTVPVFYDNIDTLDLNTITADLFVCFHIRFTTSHQANIAPMPFKRQYGRVRATCFIRENTGSVASLRVLQALTDLYQFQTLGGTHCQAASPGGEAQQKGWASIALEVPFFADSNA